MTSKIRCVILLFFCLIFPKFIYADASTSPKLVIVITSFNNINFFEKNLSSVYEQNYPNYRIIYIDDASEDGTAEAVENWQKNQQKIIPFKLIKNDRNKGGLHNIYDAVHSCEKDEIVCLLDGDDWLKHPAALNTIATAYEDKDVWLTYGQFEHYPSGKLGLCEEILYEHLIQQRTREIPWVTSHMKTFYAGLFQNIKIEDLQTLGDFVPSATDLTMMFPMLDMATYHVKFIPEVIYVYNNRNPLSHHQIRHPTQKIYAKIARMRSIYPPLSKPPYQQ